MKKILKFMMIVSIALFTCVNVVNADFIEFDFQGNAGFGLLPDNEIGKGTALNSGSPATGGEFGVGAVLDDDTNQLIVQFSFENLTDGLFFGAASGIHLHQVADANDPFNSTGGIVFNLNSFDDPNVSNFSAQIKDGATFGSVTAVVDATGFEDALLNGSIYLNIHSNAFNGGELRANLVRAIPEPSIGWLLGLSTLSLLRRKR